MKKAKRRISVESVSWRIFKIVRSKNSPRRGKIPRYSLEKLFLSRFPLSGAFAVTFGATVHQPSFYQNKYKL